MESLTVAMAEGCLHVEKDSSSFSHTFSEDPWTAMLKVELALRDWLGRNNMSGQVLLDGFTVAELDICCVQTRHMFSFGRHVGRWGMDFENSTGQEREREKIEGQMGRRKGYITARLKSAEIPIKKAPHSQVSTPTEEWQ
jgi:hypothetical protein